MAKTTLHTAHPQTLGPDSGATAPSPLAIPTAPHSFVEILSGDSDAMHRLIPLVYGELRGIAHNRRIAERDDHTLNTTAIVHEAFLKLVDATQIEVGTRASGRRDWPVPSCVPARHAVNWTEPFARRALSPTPTS